MRRASASSPPTSPSTCSRRSKKTCATVSATRKSATASSATGPSPPGMNGLPASRKLIRAAHKSRATLLLPSHETTQRKRSHRSCPRTHQRRPHPAVPLADVSQARRSRLLRRDRRRLQLSQRRRQHILQFLRLQLKFPPKPFVSQARD